MKHLKIETVEELVKLIQVIVWGFVVFVLMLVLGGIVGSMVYSVMFIAQPMKAMSPIDQAFTKMLNDIVLILASSVTTIVSMFAVNKGAQALAEKLAPTMGIPPTPPTQTYQSSGNANPCQQAQAFSGASPVVAGQPFGQMPVWVNPQLDESWTPGPPPQTPSDHMHPEREDIAMERALARNET